jgi:hypothetical protein
MTCENAIFRVITARLTALGGKTMPAHGRSAAKMTPPAP